jgi:hypothetical protein
MTVIVRRQDCQCGGITGLFFGRLEISRVTSEDETGRPGMITEIHYPPYNHEGTPLMHCGFFLNGMVISTERAHTMILNNAAARPDNIARCDVSTGGAPRGVAAGRAAEAIERYAGMPDNP